MCHIIYLQNPSSILSNQKFIHRNESHSFSKVIFFVLLFISLGLRAICFVINKELIILKRLQAQCSSVSAFLTMRVLARLL